MKKLDTWPSVFNQENFTHVKTISPFPPSTRTFLRQGLLTARREVKQRSANYAKVRSHTNGKELGWCELCMTKQVLANTLPCW